MSSASPDFSYHYNGHKIMLVPLLSKKYNFQVISTQKHLANTLGTSANQSIKPKSTKSNRVKFFFLNLDLFFRQYCGSKQMPRKSSMLHFQKNSYTIGQMTTIWLSGGITPTSTLPPRLPHEILYNLTPRIHIPYFPKDFMIEVIDSFLS